MNCMTCVLETEQLTPAIGVCTECGCGICTEHARLHPQRFTRAAALSGPSGHTVLALLCTRCAAGVDDVQPLPLGGRPPASRN